MTSTPKPPVLTVGIERRMRSVRALDEEINSVLSGGDDKLYVAKASHHFFVGGGTGFGNCFVFTVESTDGKVVHKDGQAESLA